MNEIRPPPTGHIIHLVLTVDEARWLRELVREPTHRRDAVLEFCVNQKQLPTEPDEHVVHREGLFSLLSNYFTTP